MKHNGKFNKKSTYKNIILTLVIVLLVLMLCITFTEHQQTQKQLEAIQLNQNDIISFNDEGLTTIQNKLDDFVITENSTDYTTVNDNNLMIIDESQITENLLLNRDGKIIVSKVIGKCVNSSGDGVILNPSSPDANYISYRSVKGVTENSIIITYLFYNPDSSYTDDIIYRYDYIIEH